MKRGFTLIEILIVVAIIAILASVVLIGLGPSQQAGRDARRLSDLQEIQTGLELYFSKCGIYPGDDTCGSAGTAPATWADFQTVLEDSGIGVSNVPNDPSSGKNYFYGTDSTGANYVIGAILENANNSVFNGYQAPTVDVTSWTNSSATCTHSSSTAAYCLTL